MIRIEFSPIEIDQVNYERYHHPHPRVQRKMEALWLKSQGLPHQEICRLTGISMKTLQRYLLAYQQGGIEELKEIRFYGPKSELEEHTSTIKDHFAKHPPASLKEAMDAIEKLTSIKRSLPQVRKYLLSIGMSFRKVGMVPAKADVEKQETFKKKELQPRLDAAQSGKRAVFFVDAAHFVLAPFLGFLWCFSRLFIKAPSGRKRFNVLAALNAVTHQLITVTNDTYINAQSVCDLLWQIARMNLEVPITLVLDNARYQKCAVVRELALTLNIELLYLPPYSPNLNLIERVWKFVKKQCLYSKYYEDFTAFKSAIAHCLSHLHDTHRQEMNSLLTLKFQSFKKASFVAY